MPSYDFACKCGHRTEWVGPYRDRPDDIECEACTGVAQHTVVREVAEVAVRGNVDVVAKDIVWRECECECGWSDIEEFPREQSVVSCPDCTRDVRLQMLGSHSRLNELRYGQMGRFDRGLDCWVENEKHRLAICRERNVVPVEEVGDNYLAARAARRKADEAQDIKEQEEYERRLREAPEFRRYRELEDRGYTQDLFADLRE